MRHIPPLLADCLLVGAHAVVIYIVWTSLTDTRHLTAGSVILCTLITVALAFATEAVAKRIHHGRPRRAHARTEPSRPCAASANQATTRKDTST